MWTLIVLCLTCKSSVNLKAVQYADATKRIFLRTGSKLTKWRVLRKTWMCGQRRETTLLGSGFGMLRTRRTTKANILMCTRMYSPTQDIMDLIYGRSSTKKTALKELTISKKCAWKSKSCTRSFRGSTHLSLHICLVCIKMWPKLQFGQTEKMIIFSSTIGSTTREFYHTLRE